MKIPRSELKAWARKNLKGIENTLFPSFSPDLTELDEEGIRWDVQQTIKHGFVSTLCAASTLNFQEAKRFIGIVADEAGDKLLVAVSASWDNFAQNIEFIKHAEKVGCDSVLISYPNNFYPKTADEVYQVTKQMCDAADLAMVVYPSHKFNLEKLHGSGFPLDLLERMTDIDNVVAMKLGILEPGFIYEGFRRCGDKVLVQCPWDRWLPILVTQYGQQWMGAGAYEMFQSPEKPYLVQCFNLMLEGKMDEAMEIFWKLTPVRLVFERQFMPTQQLGFYNSNQQKYYQWLVGGNGGFVRQTSMKLYQHDMEDCKRALRAIGITPREPDEEFYVGRMNYARMNKG